MQVSGDVRNLLSTDLGNNYIGEMVMSYTFRQSNENEVMALTKMSEAAFKCHQYFLVIFVCIILVKDKTRNKEKIVEKYNS